MTVANVWLVVAVFLQTPTVPLTIRVLQDVPVESGQRLPYQERGHLYIAPGLEPFTIKKGDTFQMLAIGQEGGCRIKYREREYDTPTCPWLEGFTDHQTDVFEVAK